MAKRGPKLTTIDWGQFEELCYMQCTLEEISGFFKVSPDTIERYVKSTFKIKFADYIKQRSSRGKISLRRAMFKKAIKDENTAMQIHLSKQYLGMKDNDLTQDDRNSVRVIREDYMKR